MSLLNDNINENTVTPKRIEFVALVLFVLLNDSDTELADDMHKNKQTKSFQTTCL